MPVVTIVLPIPTTESDGLVPSLPESPSADHDGLPDRGKLSAASSEPRSGAGYVTVGPSPETTRAGPGASGITVTDSLAGSMIVMTGPVREPTQARAVRLGDRTAAGSEPSGNGGSLKGQESQDLQLDSE